MHDTFMSHALLLAEKGKYTVSPNPMVGCVIVKNNQIIAEGYHQKAGEHHAEIHALNNVNDSLTDATLYVTLEPCSHVGRTPPCVNRIIESGIKKVVVATTDKNPLVSGAGIQALRNAGITVEVGILAEKAEKLNERFFYFIQNKKPFVILKWAMSIDGKTTTHSDDSKKISSHDSQTHAHALRASVDAILIGSHTALADDPLLNVRLPSHEHSKQPIKIILTSRTNIPASLKLMREGKVMIATNNSALIEKNHPAEFILVPSSENGDISLSDLLVKLGEKHITSILVEGGMTTHDYFMKQHCVNKIITYVAPTIIGSLNTKKQLNNFNTTSLGCDLLLEADYV